MDKHMALCRLAKEMLVQREREGASAMGQRVLEGRNEMAGHMRSFLRIAMAPPPPAHRNPPLHSRIPLPQGVDVTLTFLLTTVGCTVLSYYFPVSAPCQS